jgi:regulator of sirC expression with transglutaminase-like and TPR domain
MASTDTDDHELQALRSLLESEDKSLRSLLLDQIRAFPDDRFEHLSDLISPDSSIRRYLDLMLNQRDAPRIEGGLRNWLAEGCDLEEGVLLVARTGYPQLDTDQVRRELDEQAVMIRPGLSAVPGVGSLERMRQILHGQLGFHGNQLDYYNPDNSYLNRVLERRTGLPITLTVLYMLLGSRLGLTISGLALPSHFIACLETSEGRILFDPFHDGVLLSLADVQAMVRSAGFEFAADMLTPAPAQLIVRRMLANLVNAYDQRHDGARAELAREYAALIAK